MSHIAQSLRISPTLPSLAASLHSQINTASIAARAAGRLFTLAVSGGSLASQLASVDFDHRAGHWRVLFADERCVGRESKDSNQVSKDYNCEAISSPAGS